MIIDGMPDLNSKTSSFDFLALKDLIDKNYYAIGKRC